MTRYVRVGGLEDMVGRGGVGVAEGGVRTADGGF